MLQDRPLLLPYALFSLWYSVVLPLSLAFLFSSMMYKVPCVNQGRRLLRLTGMTFLAISTMVSYTCSQACSTSWVSFPRAVNALLTSILYWDVRHGSSTNSLVSNLGLTCCFDSPYGLSIIFPTSKWWSKLAGGSAPQYTCTDLKSFLWDDKLWSISLRVCPSLQ